MARRLEAKHPAAPPRPHGLPGALIVSLTSYPPRFPTLHLTIQSLLRQDVQPDRIVLWIAHADLPRLPAAVRRLERHGLEIRGCPDWRSFKKLLPALNAFPDAIIITVDDDIFYPPDQVSALVAGHDHASPSVLARRVRQVVTEPGGLAAPYANWTRHVPDEVACHSSPNLLPIGVGGVLYPPRACHAEVLDIELAMRLCPRADDLWFWWQARRAGTLVRRVSGNFVAHEWHGSEATALEQHNVYEGGNDRQIKALESHYGKIGGLL